MISMEKAFSILGRHLLVPDGSETIRLEVARGRVLAESVRSDVDLPPYDRVAMDGYAVRSADVRRPNTTLDVVETIHAGEVPRVRLTKGQACRIMTGAPLPRGADAVVMVENTRAVEEGARVLVSTSVGPGENFCPRGEDLKRGAVVLSPGRLLGPAEAGILATVGKARVPVRRRPRVTILSTGNELVAPSRKPGPGKIRNSNAFSLAHFVEMGGGVVAGMKTVRDRKDKIEEAVGLGLRSEILLLTGGVSMGAADFVPEVLEESGVRVHFHRVAIKPAKPILFGTHPKGLVFGLPGNPISSFLALSLFVLPALRRRLGLPGAPGTWGQARLGESMKTPPHLTEFRPVAFRDGRLFPVPYNGSGHLASLLAADGFAVLPSGVRSLRRGAEVGFLPLNGDCAG